MTKKEYVAAVLERYPQFEDGNAVIKLKARGIIALISQAWDEGHADASKKTEMPKGFDDIFKGFKK